MPKTNINKTSVVWRWGAILVLAILAVAGLMHLLAAADFIIACFVTLICVGLLVREIL